jgi:hypothetical protein
MTVDASPNLTKIENTSQVPPHQIIKRHSHWITHIVLWVLATTVVVLGVKLVKIQKNVARLDNQISGLSEQVRLIGSASSPASSSAPTSSAIPLTPQTSLAVVTPPSSSKVTTSTTTPLSNLPSIGTLTVLPSATATPTLPEWVRQAPLSVAQSFLRAGNWEAATTLVDLLLSSASASKSDINQLSSLRKVLQSQQPALTQMKKMLVTLEKQVAQLPQHSLIQTSSTTDTDAKSSHSLKHKEATTSTKWEQLWTEMRQDLSSLVQIESRQSINLRQKNETAFYWKTQIIQSLHQYHQAWLQNSNAEQERLQQYINALLNYAFDMNTEEAHRLQKTLNDYFKQPTPISPTFPLNNKTGGDAA